MIFQHSKFGIFSKHFMKKLNTQDTLVRCSTKYPPNFFPPRFNRYYLNYNRLSLDELSAGRNINLSTAPTLATASALDLIVDNNKYGCEMVKTVGIRR